MKNIIAIFIIILIVSSINLAQEKQLSSFPEFTPYVNVQDSSEKNSKNIAVRDLGMDQPARWLSVDPMADKYPGWSPCHYSLNNPLRFIDPNGMWSAEYDKDKNTVSVRYEKGDTYEGLYKQLGMSAGQFSKQYNVDLSKKIAGNASFDVTDRVLLNKNIDGNAGEGNCMSFVLNARGDEIPQAMSVKLQSGEVLNLPATESRIVDENFGNTLQNKYGYGSTSSPRIGDVTVFTGNYNNNTQNSIHTGIYLLNNQAGEAQYISRNGVGAPVSINTITDYRNIYNNASPSVSINGIYNYHK